MPVVPRVPPFDRSATARTWFGCPAVSSRRSSTESCTRTPVRRLPWPQCHGARRDAPPAAHSRREAGGLADPARTRIAPGRRHPGSRPGRLATVAAPRLARHGLLLRPARVGVRAPVLGPASFRARKLVIYARERVSHVWLIDPVGRTLEVRRLEDGRWTAWRPTAATSSRAWSRSKRSSFRPRCSGASNRRGSPPGRPARRRGVSDTYVDDRSPRSAASSCASEVIGCGWTAGPRANGARLNRSRR